MKSNKRVLADWLEIENRHRAKGALNPIDMFLYDNEPTGIYDSENFRTQLLAAINHESEEEITERNADIISKFIKHCKEEGLDIDETYFKSFFNA